MRSPVLNSYIYYKTTVQSYADSLKPFQDFCDLQEIKELAEVENFLVDVRNYC